MIDLMKLLVYAHNSLGRNQTYMEIPTIQLLGHYVTEFEL